MWKPVPREPQVWNPTRVAVSKSEIWRSSFEASFDKDNPASWKPSFTDWKPSFIESFDKDNPIQLIKSQGAHLLSSSRVKAPVQVETMIPNGITTTSRDQSEVGFLKEGMLHPSDKVLCDQMESHNKGRLLQTTRREHDLQRFSGPVEYEVTLSTPGTIKSKSNCEWKAREMGTISTYSPTTNSDVCKATHFLTVLEVSLQAISSNRVGVPWHNGATDGVISYMISKAPTVMIQAATSLAVSHATNHNPNESCGTSYSS